MGLFPDKYVKNTTTIIRARESVMVYLREMTFTFYHPGHKFDTTEFGILRILIDEFLGERGNWSSGGNICDPIVIGFKLNQDIQIPREADLDDFFSKVKKRLPRIIEINIKIQVL